MAPLSEAERLDWLRLIRTPRVGPRTFRALLARCGSAGEALRALPDLAAARGRRGMPVASVAAAERELAAAERLGIRFVAQVEPDYPAPLLAIDTAPPLLAVRGDLPLLRRPAVAIVGSRNASAAGGAFAARLAGELGRAGFAVVSGLARGIDARAHAGSLATGTVAVLAGGHDRVYPSDHVALLDRILEAGGTAVSELPLGAEPRAQDFPRRNRIVSGLSYGVVVVEAARRSGSLITARLALEQGREVFAVPGSPLDPRAEGTNDLIRAGATLCAAADHVTGVLAPLTAAPAEPVSPRSFGEAAGFDELWLDDDDSLGAMQVSSPPTDDAEADARAIVLTRLGPVPVTPDDLGRATGLPARTIQHLLVELELEGRLERMAGGTVALRMLDV